MALNGRWGTICEDEEWDTDNAMVACEELGFTTEDGYSITPSTRYALVLIASTHYDKELGLIDTYSSGYLCHCQYA